MQHFRSAENAPLAAEFAGTSHSHTSVLCAGRHSGRHRILLTGFLPLYLLCRERRLFVLDTSTGKIVTNMILLDPKVSWLLAACCADCQPLGLMGGSRHQ